MSSVDERVVEMKFDKGDFEKGVKATLGTLDKLKSGLKLEGAKDGLEEVNGSVKKFSMENIAKGVEKVSSKFNALGAIGFSVLNNLTTKALNFGMGLINKVLDPIVQGGRARAENIEQAKFQFKGLGLSVEEAMANALDAVKGTAFGLDEAASAAGQLAASQIPLGNEMTRTLRAIAGVAAQTGSSYDDISNIFVGVAGNTRVMGDDLLQMSSRGLNAAAILGKAMGKSEADVRKMVSAGKVDFATFRDAMDETFGKNAAKANETYSGALSNMRAALSRLGAAFQTPNLESDRRVFNELAPAIDKVKEALDPLIVAYDKFKSRSTTALVKFIRGLDFTSFGAMAGPVVQGLENIVKALKAIVKPIRDAFVEMFPPEAPLTMQRYAKAFREFTKYLILTGPAAEGLKSVFKGLFAIIQILWMVLKGVLTVIASIVGAISGGSGAANAITDLANGFGDGLTSARDFLAEGGRMQTWFENAAKFITRPIKWIQDFAAGLGEAAGNAKGFGDVIGGIGAGFAAFGVWVGKAWTSMMSIDWSKYSGLAGLFGKRFKGLEKIGKTIGETWGGITKKLGAGADATGDAADKAGQKVDNFWTKINDGLKKADFSIILDAINTVFIGGVATSIALFFFKMKELFKDGIFGAIFGKKEAEEDAGSFKESTLGILDGVTETLGAMQQQLKAKALLTIAIAIGILAASLVVLSLIDSKRLTAALVAITVMFGQLSGAMAVFAKVAGIAGIAKLPLLAGGLIVLGIAIFIMAGAVSKLAKLDWGELSRGLVGVAAILGMMIGVSYGLNGAAKGITTMGFAMIIMGLGLQVMAKAVQKFADMDWGELIRGLTGFGLVLGATLGYVKLMGKSSGEAVLGALALLAVSQAMSIFAGAIKRLGGGDVGVVVQGLAAVAIMLGIVAGFTRIVGNPAGLVSTGLGLIAIAFAIQMLVKPIKDLGSLDIGQVALGLGAIAAALLIFGIASAAINPVQFAGFGLALGIVALAVNLLAIAFAKMAKLSWEDFGKVMAVMAGGLILLAAAMYAMAGGLPGAAALIVAAGALAILAPAMVILGAMSWGDIWTGLGAMALALGLLAIAGVALLPAIPGLIGLGIALGLIGIGVGIAAAGIGLLAIGLTSLGTAGPGAATGITAIATAILNLLPLAIQKLGEGLVAFAGVIGTSGPALVSAFVALVGSMLTGINKLVPQIINTVLSLIISLMNGINAKLPQFLALGTAIMVSFLNGIASRITALANAATNVIIAFINGIGNNATRVTNAATQTMIKFIDALGKNSVELANAGLDAIVDFVNGIADAVSSHTSEMQAAGRKLAVAIADGMTGGLASKVSSVVEKAKGLANSAVNAAKNLLGIHSPSRVFNEIGVYSGEGFANGLDSMASVAARSSQKVGSAAVNSMRNSMSNVASIAKQDIDSTPTIRPVLDLSDVKKKAGNIGGMMGVPSIKAKATYASATAADAEVKEVRATQATPPAPTTVHKTVKVEQNNTSPKALEPIEIYRDTKNAVSIGIAALDKDE